jgi:hypothetical protein
LLLTAIIAFGFQAVFTLLPFIGFNARFSLAKYSLSNAIMMWTYAMSIKPGSHYAAVLGIMVLLGLLGLLDDREIEANAVKATSYGIICWTGLAAARLYMHRNWPNALGNWKVPRLGLPVAYLTLEGVTTRFVQNRTLSSCFGPKRSAFGTTSRLIGWVSQLNVKAKPQA